jgi:hypothetical protein
VDSENSKGRVSTKPGQLQLAAKRIASPLVPSAPDQIYVKPCEFATVPPTLLSIADEVIE